MSREKSKQRIGIYAGAFDPVHDGHVAFAKEAMQKAHLDRVYFLVEPRPRHKQGVKSVEHRMAMVGLAIAHERHLGHIMIDQSRFTVHETWPVLQSRFAGAQLFMLMGEDVFMRLTQWPRIDELITSVQFVVGLRSSHDESEIRSHFAMLERTRALQLQYNIFKAEHAHYGSRHVRAMLRRGEIPRGISPAVLDYIQTHRLYSSDLAA